MNIVSIQRNIHWAAMKPTLLRNAVRRTRAGFTIATALMADRNDIKCFTPYLIVLHRKKSKSTMIV